ncbi:MAG: ABC transporter ATP-binding protein [Chloroflexota bacterium]
MDKILQTHQLSKQFGGVTAVNQLDFVVSRNQIRTIIGPNGAGKTTLLRLIMGELAASSGEITFEDQRIDGLPSHKIARLGIAKAFQIPQLFPELTVYENVWAAAQKGKARLWGGQPWRRSMDKQVQTILTQVGLAGMAQVGAGELAHGDQKRLEIGLALGGSPKLLLLDEPTAGLSLHETDAIMKLLQSLRGQITVVMVEHDMRVVMNLADVITVLHFGELLAQGTPDEIRADPNVREVYLSQHA